MSRHKLSYDEKAFIFIGVLVIFKLIYTIGLNIIPDEAYYFLWGKNIQLSYFDHPPMIGWLFGFVSVFFTNPEFVVHLLPILLGAGTSLYAYYLGKDMFNDVIAFTFLVMSNFTLLLFAGTIIATPDTPMIFFLTGGIYHFYIACRRGTWYRWLLAGFFFGCALLSKYVAILIFPALLFYMIFSPERTWLKSIKPYIALLVSFVVFLPVIIWNAQNNWLSFSFQLKHGIGGTFPNWQTFGDFLGGQAGILGPLLFAILIIVVIKIIVEWKYHTKEVRLLFFLTLVFFGFFLLSSIQKKVEANWAAFAYIPGMLLVTYMYLQDWQVRVGWRITWVINWFLLIIVLLIVLVQVHVPIIPIKYDPTDQFYGWKRLGLDAELIINDFPELIPAANRHQVASELIVYSGKEFVCFDIGNRIHQFTLWRDEESLIGRDFLLFDQSKKLHSSVISCFERVEFLTSIPRFRGLKLLQVIMVYKAEKYLGDNL
ncbi:MAG: glycosyltransferase family 39 protein [Candidatus Cloacimonetes bacterium]|nr:glycosyltransferase family 39 protein [Candidatus Cloacimonadota bacterium]